MQTEQSLTRLCSAIKRPQIAPRGDATYLMGSSS